MSQTQISPPRSRPRMRRRVSSASALNSVSISDNGFAINIRLDKYIIDLIACLYLHRRILERERNGFSRSNGHSTGGSRPIWRHRGGRDEEVGRGMLRPLGARGMRPDDLESV